MNTRLAEVSRADKKQAVYSVSPKTNFMATYADVCVRRCSGLQKDSADKPLLG